MRRSAGPTGALVNALRASYGHHQGENNEKTVRIRAEDVSRSLARSGYEITLAPPKRIAPPPDGDDLSSLIRSIRHHLAVIRIAGKPEELAIADALEPVLERLVTAPVSDDTEEDDIADSDGRLAPRGLR